jgi:hypothetical protein
MRATIAAVRHTSLTRLIDRPCRPPATPQSSQGGAAQPKREVQVHVYRGAGHGFGCDERGSYSKLARESKCARWNSSPGISADPTRCSTEHALRPKLGCALTPAPLAPSWSVLTVSGIARTSCHCEVRSKEASSCLTSGTRLVTQETASALRASQ